MANSLSDPRDLPAISVSSLLRYSRQAMFRCSRFCNGQSTQEQQRSTSASAQAVCFSIKSTYFLVISTGFNKQCDLLWDRWSHLDNLHKLNGLQRGLAGDSVGFVALQVSSLRLCAGIL